jgi:hypothetical protein
MRFTDHGKRQVLATFDGSDITSDPGGVLLRETAERLNLFGRELWPILGDGHDQAAAVVSFSGT